MKLDLEVLYDAVEAIADAANEWTNKVFVQSQMNLKNQIDKAVEEEMPPMRNGNVDVNIDLNGRVEGS